MGRILLPWFLGEVGLSSYPRRWRDILRKKNFFEGPRKSYFGAENVCRMRRMERMAAWYMRFKVHSMGLLLGHFGGTFGTLWDILGTVCDAFRVNRIYRYGELSTARRGAEWRPRRGFACVAAHTHSSQDIVWEPEEPQRVRPPAPGAVTIIAPGPGSMSQFIARSYSIAVRDCSAILAPWSPTRRAGRPRRGPRGCPMPPNRPSPGVLGQFWRFPPRRLFGPTWPGLRPETLGGDG